jgi:hypothetical protein
LGTQNTSWLRVAVFTAVAVILAWQVTTRSLAAYLASAAPESALRLHATDARALLALAERNLAQSQAEAARRAGPPTADPNVREKGETERGANRLRLWAEQALRTAEGNAGEVGAAERQTAAGQPVPSGPSPQAREQMRAWTEVALASDPLNARALSVMGQLAYAAGDEAGMARFFQAAARRSIRESVALYWLMRKSYETRDYATALYCADALLRTRSQAASYVMPVLLHMAENRSANGGLKQALIDNPPWRPSFLSLLGQKAADPRATLELLLAIRETTNPPTMMELRNFIGSLIGRKEYELAYYAWLQFLPQEQLSSMGLLFNGSFEVRPSGLPFDWVIGEGQGVTVETAERPDRDGQRALFIEFGHGRIEFPGVQQLTMLAPGSYEFKGRYKGEIIGKRGLVWRIACADKPGSPIGESAMATGASPKWKEVEFAFTVPDAGCRAQQVRLEHDARMPSEQMVTGSIWYDELRIVRAASAERP